MFSDFDEYVSHFDFGSAFVDWWNDVYDDMVKAVGEKQAGWIGLQIIESWHESPSALAVAKDNWDDEMRSNNRWS